MDGAEGGNFKLVIVNVLLQGAGLYFRNDTSYVSKGVPDVDDGPWFPSALIKRSQSHLHTFSWWPCGVGIVNGGMEASYLNFLLPAILTCVEVNMSFILGRLP